MVTNLVNRGLLAAIAASALALVALLLSTGVASANGSLGLSADPSSIEPNGTTTVSMSVTPSGSDVVGGVTASITYDETLLTVDSCTPASLCNPAFGPGEVRIALFDAAGLSGVEATVTFTSTGTEGSATVEVEAVDCQDDVANPITCTGGSTTITIAAATPTPTASPAPSATTAAPTSPGALPSTGGLPGDSDGISVSSALLALLAVTGLVAVSGAVWATARARRLH